MKDLNQKIKRLLKAKAHLRDNDGELIVAIWEGELIDAFYPMSWPAFFGLLADRKISWPDSITRERRLLQAEFKGLRGKKWKARHAKADEVRKTIKRR